MGRLRIAQFAPLWLPVPPVRYGGTERVVHALTEELVRRGHEVTLFAAGGSRTSARLRQGSDRPLWELPSDSHLALQVLQLEDLARAADAFDVVHCHMEMLPWLLGERVGAPLITTLHGRLDLPHQRPLFAAFDDRPLVSISDAQRAPLRDLHLNWVATVHHGLELGSSFSLGRGDGGYVLFLGRIAPEKDPATAIRVAIRAGVRLRIAARVDPADEDYFRRAVAPYLDHPLVEWVGEVGHPEKARLLAGARALLLPIDWPEPFGLVFIEALACGTPVIARRRGSLPEIVRHGLDGWLAETDDEMVEAIAAAPTLDRAACREYALARFGVERMASDYEHLYRRAVAGTELTLAAS
ncbi:MAG: glycosyltransferase family 4 protein [Candidatus Limnocylindria bacterium]